MSFRHFVYVMVTFLLVLFLGYSVVTPKTETVQNVTRVEHHVKSDILIVHWEETRPVSTHLVITVKEGHNNYNLRTPCEVHYDKSGESYVKLTHEVASGSFPEYEKAQVYLRNESQLQILDK